MDAATIGQGQGHTPEALLRAANQAMRFGKGNFWNLTAMKLGQGVARGKLEKP